MKGLTGIKGLKEPQPKSISSDSGVATVWAAGAIAGLLSLFLGLFTFASVVMTKQRVATAADLAALAAAGRSAHGAMFACERARWVATQMSTSLLSCRIEGQDALVEVTAGLPSALTRFGVVQARARAGPAA